MVLPFCFYLMCMVQSGLEFTNGDCLVFDPSCNSTKAAYIPICEPTPPIASSNQACLP